MAKVNYRTLSLYKVINKDDGKRIITGYWHTQGEYGKIKDQNFDLNYILKGTCLVKFSSIHVPKNSKIWFLYFSEKKKIMGVKVAFESSFNAFMRLKESLILF
jgi:hypothetical protein